MRFVHVASVLLAGAIVVAALPAEAQSRRIHRNNWRQYNRGSGIYEGTPQNFAFELRGGPYYPAVDEEFGGAGPYAKYFGDSGRVALGFEFDWQAARIPWIGTVGPGIGITYTSATAGAFSEADLSIRAGETALKMMPMHVSAVIRFDELFRRTQIPIVPYVKLGVGYGLWWCTAGSNDCKIAGTEVIGRGSSFGVHFALGGAIALDFLGRREMSALDQQTGINHIYLFGEWFNQNLGLGTNQMRIGTSTFMTGLAFEI